MSHKSEQKERKAQLQESAKRKDKLLGTLAKFGLPVVAILVVLVLLQGILSSVPALPPQTVGPLDHVRGAEDAQLVITIYADFECPQCLTEMELVARAWPQIEDEAMLVYRHFPLDIHRHAFIAARYAEAAGRQDKFWEMHDLMFVNQAQWKTLDSVSELFSEFALQLGLDMQQFEEDLSDGSIRDKILADQQGGVKAGVRGTPSMFFNGKLVDTPRSSSQFLSMVREALE